MVIDDHLSYDSLIADDPDAWAAEWGRLAAEIAADPALVREDQLGLGWGGRRAAAGGGVRALPAAWAGTPAPALTGVRPARRGA